VSILASAQVQRALQELRAVGEREDRRYRERVSAREGQMGSTLSPGDRAALAVDAPLAISAEVGEVLHALALTARPSLIVEFGASLGISTIYLASALADLGAGLLITTDSSPRRPGGPRQRSSAPASVATSRSGAATPVTRSPASIDKSICCFSTAPTTCIWRSLSCSLRDFPRPR
jgi:hypothetical protein